MENLNKIKFNQKDPKMIFFKTWINVVGEIKEKKVVAPRQLISYLQKQQEFPGGDAGEAFDTFVENFGETIAVFQCLFNIS
jgi:hypothetical protein